MPMIAENNVSYLISLHSNDNIGKSSFAFLKQNNHIMRQTTADDLTKQTTADKKIAHEEVGTDNARE